MPMPTPGTRIIVTQDCRENGTATGEHGIYEGQQESPFGLNPHLKLDNGDSLFGFECWWTIDVGQTPAEMAQQQEEAADVVAFVKGLFDLFE